MTMPALMTLKKTGQSFFAKETELRKVFPLPPFSAPVLTAADCEKPRSEEARRMGFVESDIAIMCSLLTDPEFGAYRQKTMRSQWSALAIYAALLLFFAYRTAVLAVRVACARKLLNRRVDPAMPAAQMELDFDSR